jgi:hypothetical protein
MFPFIRDFVTRKNEKGRRMRRRRRRRRRRGKVEGSFLSSSPSPLISVHVKYEPV